ncbi:HNH endonuclease [Pseudohoeflea coraliihabitans]|uniref:HNH endonuclease n=1 Tax=Pseudohoeflea coraliihabitans TaxID=2860393 RepID=A0ABS6WIQ7_9HYPH|nr:HNH endonuclease [Pseudohoeflea sp. DP4N28-3]MBW3095675.1 HNH endonuclease [Pseudohoeflea sp. DP4N28-3]
MMPRYPIVAFLSKAETHGLSAEKCWAWKGAGKGNGYGHFSLLGERMGAHRAAYIMFKGDVPNGMDVCHHCDNRWCVNPAHLFIGSRSQNMADMSLKGRGSGGCRKHIKEHQVQEIRRRIHAGVRMSEIAKQMGVNYSTVTAINRGDSYVGISQ